MRALTCFRGTYCAGPWVENSELVTTLALLFEKVHLPNNLDLIKELVKKYSIRSTAIESIRDKFHWKTSMICSHDSTVDALQDLTGPQRDSALVYIDLLFSFVYRYADLFPDVFETKLLRGRPDFVAKSIRKTGKGKYSVTLISSPLTLVGGEDDFSDACERGYIPVIGTMHEHLTDYSKANNLTARQLAALLAMKSVSLVLPRGASATGEAILEARHKLRNHLPPFWSAMLQMSAFLRDRVSASGSLDEVFREAQDVVDTKVLPALVDLQNKIDLERKQWFYKVVQPVGKTLRVLAGFPLMTQQELLTSAILCGLDVTETATSSVQAIERLRANAGLTYLVDLGHSLESQ